MELNPDFWRRCSSCKNPIRYSAPYYVCSVSTCNRKRIGYVFDSVHCWERHLPGARHKDAAAVEAKAPTFEQWKAELGADAVAPGTSTGTAPSGASAGSGSRSQTPSPAEQAAAVAAARAPQRVLVRPATAAKAGPRDSVEAEILIVVSKLKSYIRDRSEMNTSDSVAHVLSDRVRRLCDRAIENARADGRKTVMDRDFEGI
jgi:hypothetical protein